MKAQTKKNAVRLVFVMLLGTLTLGALTGCSSVRKNSNKTDGLQIYFVRHAETVGNVTGLKNTLNNSTFTETGKQQIDVLTEQLKTLNIDQVIVSPTYRTRHTVLPFLKSSNKTAEIWPELEEWRMEAQVQMGLEPLDGSPIEIEEENQDYFRFRDESATHRYVAGDYTGGLQQLDKVVTLLRDRYFGEDKTLLLIGHKDMGSRIIETLMGLDPEVNYKPEFAKLNHLRQKDKKRFELILFNDESVIKN